MDVNRGAEPVGGVEILLNNSFPILRPVGMDIGRLLVAIVGLAVAGHVCHRKAAIHAIDLDALCLARPLGDGEVTVLARLCRTKQMLQHGRLAGIHPAKDSNLRKLLVDGVASKLQTLFALEAPHPDAVGDSTQHLSDGVLPLVSAEGLDTGLLAQQQTLPHFRRSLDALGHLQNPLRLQQPLGQRRHPHGKSFHTTFIVDLPQRRHGENLIEVGHTIELLR
mmetsp:Transcript_17148/g.40606  ORF Transcript_17148/g.40606 Transcript_17148/m.40606 type:complete len:222 (-) Transcript_17148:212-877(-)